MRVPSESFNCEPVCRLIDETVLWLTLSVIEEDGSEDDAKEDDANEDGTSEDCAS